MPHYKLTYFNLRGRGEVSRLIFAVAGVDYEDYRIERSQWDIFRPKINSPFDQVPLLEVDGAIVSQSHTIERYLANQFGLAGKSDWEKARCDMVVDCVEDMIKDLVKIRKEPNKERKARMISVQMEFVEKSLNNFAKLLETNQGGDGYFVGKELTYADLVFYHYPTAIEISTERPIDWTKWPKLKALRERVEQLDRISAWLKKRPVTPL